MYFFHDAFNIVNNPIQFDHLYQTRHICVNWSRGRPRHERWGHINLIRFILASIFYIEKWNSHTFFFTLYTFVFLSKSSYFYQAWHLSGVLIVLSLTHHMIYFLERKKKLLKRGKVWNYYINIGEGRVLNSRCMGRNSILYPLG